MKPGYNAKVFPSAAFPIAVFIFISLFFSGCKKEQKAAPTPPVVEVTDVIERDVPIYAEWVGSADGFVNATIRAQVQGYLMKQNYREGDFVRKGQVLFEIDPRTFKAAVDEASGNLERAKSDLVQQEARWVTAKANLERIKPLAARNAVSQKDLDDATGTELSTKAGVDAAKAAVSAAEAALETAKLNLSFTTITSPIDGIAGIAKAQIGNLVGPSSTQELTSVSTVNPIKVYINVSEQEYLNAREKHSNVEDIPLQLTLADGTVFPQKGHFYLADRQIDVTTGTLKIGTIFANPNNMLRPGQFGKVRAVMDLKRGALLAPQRAVTEMQGRYLVAVVGPDNKVDIRPVKLGEQVGSDYIISEGLKPGEKIVAEGIQKVKQGLVVAPKPFEPEKQTAAPNGSGKTAEKPAPAPAEKR